jgi:hypothetical protein
VFDIANNRLIVHHDPGKGKYKEFLLLKMTK